MRKLLISAAAAVSALAVATPAAAQWMPQPVGYGSAYGYGNPGQAQALQAQIGQLRMQIRQLGMSNMLSRGEFRRLDWEAGSLDQRVRAAAFNGMSPREGYDIQRRIARLQQRIQLAMYNGNRRYGYGSGAYGGYGYGSGYGSGGYGGYGGYGGLGTSFGHSSYYGGSPSHNGQVVQYDGRDTQRMPSMRGGSDRGFSSRGGETRNMPSMNARGGRSSTLGGRGMGRRGGRDRN